jgi:hypothetical protein
MRDGESARLPQRVFNGLRMMRDDGQEHARRTIRLRAATSIGVERCTCT